MRFEVRHRIPVDGSPVRGVGAALRTLRVHNRNPFPVEQKLWFLLMPVRPGQATIHIGDAASVPIPLTVPPHGSTELWLWLIGRRGELRVECGHMLAPASPGSSPWGTPLPALLSDFANLRAETASRAALFLNGRTDGLVKEAARRAAYLCDVAAHEGWTFHLGVRLDPPRIGSPDGPRLSRR